MVPCPVPSAGVKNVLVKLGARGSMMIPQAGDIIEQKAFHADKIIDTTGCGDCFTGIVLQTASSAFPVP